MREKRTVVRSWETDDGRGLLRENLGDDLTWFVQIGTATLQDLIDLQDAIAVAIVQGKAEGGAA